MHRAGHLIDLPHRVQVAAVPHDQRRTCRFQGANHDHVWDYNWDGEISIVESYISYLRRKIDSPEALGITDEDEAALIEPLIHKTRNWLRVALREVSNPNTHTPKFRPRTTSTLSFRLVYAFVMLMIIVVTAVSSIAVTIYQRYLVQSIDDALTVSGRVVAVQIIDDLRRSGDSSNDNIMLSDYYINAVLQEQAGQTYIGKEHRSSSAREQYGTQPVS